MIKLEKTGLISRHHCPAISMQNNPGYKFIDATGAGDSFTGAFAVTDD